MKILPFAAGAAIALSSLASCGEEKHSYVPNAISGELTPTMLTVNVNTFISDSGYTRYHITAPQWGMYEDAAEPFWKFPDGIFLEQYDRDLNPTSSIRSDSARYLSQKRIWRLDGNVVMVNTAGDSFLTQQVYWNQVRREVYSDSFIHIVRSDRVIEGYGFTSNEQMTSYTVNKPTGIFPSARGPQPQAEPSQQGDSAEAPRRRPPVRTHPKAAMQQPQRLEAEPQLITE
ncbi:MAG: LPS export ABC transporter periplasmic protein LptC [Clostridium sp.]|nr:LPS export ABC transporter periplasmic protein LptC [Clostridium sp.]